MTQHIDKTRVSAMSPGGQLPGLDASFSGQGEMAARLRSVDWSQTGFGPVATWPVSLRDSVSYMLRSDCPACIVWGPELRFLYNDGYRPLLGKSKHPRALGAPVREIFPEAWDRLAPQLERVRNGELLVMDDFELVLDRNDYVENCWFAFSSCPIPDLAGNVGGVLSIVIETTLRVEERRRLETLRELLRRGLDGTSLEQVCRKAARIFERNRVDIPFALVYAISDDGLVARLVASAGLGQGHPGQAPQLVREAAHERDWPVFEVADARRSMVCHDLAARAGPLPGGPYAEPARTAVLLPLGSRRRRSRAVLIAGVSPRRALDRPYRTFLELCAEQITSAVVRIEAGEVDRTRASALREAERANRAKDEFMALLGHELRNPLAPILTAVELMKLKDGKLLERERSVIERQARHMVQLVDDLLDVSRVTRGKVQLRTEPLEVSAVIAQAVETVSPLIEQRQHRLSVSVPRAGLLVRGDPFRLAQVFANLLTNSAKYTPSGGHIALAASSREGRVEISIRDDGSGIPRAMLERIFEPFVQGERSADGSSGGLGLGLPLVRSLVELHAGVVRAHSDGPGKGSEFVVELPLLVREHEDAAGGTNGSQEQEAPDSTKQRLLVVDDNADAAEMIAEGLRVLGYRVRVAYDAPTALSVAGQFRPEYAVLDIGLPVMDGYELGKKLRELLGDRLVLVAVTGYAQEGDRERSRRENFSDHLVKPIDLGLLARSLDLAKQGTSGS